MAAAKELVEPPPTKMSQFTLVLRELLVTSKTERKYKAIARVVDIYNSMKELKKRVPVKH